MNDLKYQLKHLYVIPIFISIYTEKYEILCVTTYLCFISLLFCQHKNNKLLEIINYFSYFFIFIYLFYIIYKKLKNIFLIFLLINCIIYGLISYFSIFFQILFDNYFVSLFILLIIQQLIF